MHSRCADAWLVARLAWRDDDFAARWLPCARPFHLTWCPCSRGFLSCRRARPLRRCWRSPTGVRWSLVDHRHMSTRLQLTEASDHVAKRRQASDLSGSHKGCTRSGSAQPDIRKTCTRPPCVSVVHSRDCAHAAKDADAHLCVFQDGVGLALVSLARIDAGQHTGGAPLTDHTLRAGKRNVIGTRSLGARWLCSWQCHC